MGGEFFEENSLMIFQRKNWLGAVLLTGQSAAPALYRECTVPSCFPRGYTFFPNQFVKDLVYLTGD